LRHRHLRAGEKAERGQQASGEQVGGFHGFPFVA
jgi:hypothetical protein